MSFPSSRHTMAKPTKYNPKILEIFFRSYRFEHDITYKLRSFHVGNDNNERYLLSLFMIFNQFFSDWKGKKVWYFLDNVSQNWLLCTIRSSMIRTRSVHPGHPHLRSLSQAPHPGCFKSATQTIRAKKHFTENLLLSLCRTKNLGRFRETYFLKTHFMHLVRMYKWYRIKSVYWVLMQNIFSMGAF